MPLQGEVLADRPEALGGTPECVSGREPPHASLAFAGRLMAVLGAVVHAGAAFTNTCLTLASSGMPALAAR